MTATAICKTCGNNFRKFSLKSKESHCQDCTYQRKRNKYYGFNTRASKEKQQIDRGLEDMAKQVKDLANQIEILHATIGTEIQHQISKGLDPIIKKLIDAELTSINDRVASSFTKSMQAKEQVKVLAGQVKAFKTSNTKMLKKIEKIRKEIK